MESLEYAGSGGTPTRVTRHVYDGNEVVAEYEVSGGQATLAREFAWGDAFPDPVAMVLPNGTSTEVYYHVKDSLGSVVALVDYYGDTVETYRYDPYGRVFARDAAGNPLAASAVGNPFTYTGQRYDWVVGLHHFKYRSYSPRLGRWMQRDPAGYVDGVSLYEYVGSNPTNAIDQLGLYDVWSAGKGVATGVITGAVDGYRTGGPWGAAGGALIHGGAGVLWGVESGDFDWIMPPGSNPQTDTTQPNPGWTPSPPQTPQPDPPPFGEQPGYPPDPPPPAPDPWDPHCEG